MNLEQIESGTGRLLGEPVVSSDDSMIKFEKGDVLFAKLRPYLAKSWLVESVAHGSGELMAMVPHSDVDPRFLLYNTLSVPWLQWAEMTSYGTKMPRTSWEAMSSLRLAVPPLEEQRAIAEFLDDQTARIDHVIVARNQQVDRLQSTVEAVAWAAVTGAELSDDRVPSKLAWVADLPADWGSPRIRQVARMGTGHTPSRSEPSYWIECDIPWLTTGDVHRFRSDQVEAITDTALHISQLGLANSAAVLHASGTVALSRTASAGFSIVMDGEMATSQDYATWTCGPGLDNYYLLWCLRSMRRDLMGRLATGSTHKTIYFPDLMSIRIPLPPLSQQRAAVSQIRRRLGATRRAQSGLRSSVKLLLEFKRSLISAAVSGEFDVSSASGRGVPA